MKSGKFRVIYIDYEGEIHVKYFRGRIVYSILPYFEDFEDDIEDVILIEKPVNGEYLYS